MFVLPFVVLIECFSPFHSVVLIERLSVFHSVVLIEHLSVFYLVVLTEHGAPCLCSLSLSHGACGRPDSGSPENLIVFWTAKSGRDSPRASHYETVVTGHHLFLVFFFLNKNCSGSGSAVYMHPCCQ